MYEIRFNGTKVQKKFNKLKQKLSNEVKTRMKEALENNPYPSPTYGRNRNVATKIEKKGKIYCYEVTGGDRILFDIYQKPIHAVLILFAGNDDEEQRFLKKHAK
jgi:mRNA-degrading endonuclease RelE of RelBE toxin-antitoxin system